MWREMRGERKRERERKQEGANSNELVQTRKKSVLLRALGAQPRRRKPAFVTHDNEASLCVCVSTADLTTCFKLSVLLPVIS